jgi:hypothetical protein
VLSGLTGYLTLILDDTAQNTLDLCDADAILVDLGSDLSGAIQRAAEEMAGGSNELSHQTCRPPLLHRRLGRPHWAMTRRR